MNTKMLLIPLSSCKLVLFKRPNINWGQKKKILVDIKMYLTPEASIPLNFELCAIDYHKGILLVTTHLPVVKSYHIYCTFLHFCIKFKEV